MIGAIICTLYACNKKQAPVMGSIIHYDKKATPYTLTLGASIYDTGGDAITDKGFCYRRGGGVVPTYTNCDSVVQVRGYTSVGYFEHEIGGLHPNTTYIIVAYAVNSVDTSYSNAVYVSTLK